MKIRINKSYIFAITIPFVFGDGSISKATHFNIINSMVYKCLPGPYIKQCLIVMIEIKKQVIYYISRLHWHVSGTT